MLRKHPVILLLILIASVAKQSYGQNDSTKQAKNYYAPWNQTIKDTSKWNVSKFGIYLSSGFGYPHDYKYGGLMPLQDIISTYHITKFNGYYGSGGVAKLSRFSFAYKSHLLSITNGQSYAGTYSPTPYSYSSSYYGLLVGESVRFKHLIISLSAGIAHTNLFIQGIPFYNTHTLIGDLFHHTYVDVFTSFPIELKAFYLARNGIGVGVHISENIVPYPKYTPFSACVSVVFGFWNKPKDSSFRLFK
jgi:hypothetical protein